MIQLHTVRIRVVLAVTSVALVSGCAVIRPAVPVFAPPADLQALVGEWHGEYSSSATGRSGSIFFELQSGRDTASGDVVMVPRGSSDPQPFSRRITMASARLLAQVLRIRFVRVENGEVSGRLEPYRDDECACTLVTTFTGRLRDGNTIDGTFVTQTTSGTTQTGRWSATRVAQ